MYIYIIKWISSRFLISKCPVKFARHNFNLELVFQVFTKSDFKLNWFNYYVTDR